MRTSTRTDSSVLNDPAVRMEDPDESLLPRACRDDLDCDGQMEWYVQHPGAVPSALRNPHQSEYGREEGQFCIGLGLLVSGLGLLYALTGGAAALGFLIGSGMFLALILLIPAGELFKRYRISRDTTDPLLNRPHAREFPRDGHTMFCVTKGVEKGLPILRLQRWEPCNWRTSITTERVTRLEGDYDRRTLKTVYGSDPHDVATLAAARPELEEEARVLEERAYQALHIHRERVQARLQQGRADHLDSAASVKLIG